MGAVKISDIKAYVKDSDADVSVVKLGGVYRLVGPDGYSTPILNEAITLEYLRTEYPMPELDYGDLNDLEDDFINDEELIESGSLSYPQSVKE